MKSPKGKSQSEDWELAPSSESQFLCWIEDDWPRYRELHDHCDDPLEAAERHVAGLFAATGEVLDSTLVIVQDCRGQRHTIKVTAEVNVSFSGSSMK